MEGGGGGGAEGGSGKPRVICKIKVSRGGRPNVLF